MGEFHQRQRVEDDFFAFALDRQGLKHPAGAEAGAVAQTGYRFAAKPLCQLPPGRGLAQVERHNVDPYRVLRAQLAGEVIQAFPTAGDQHQRVAAPCQTAGQLGADARGGTGDNDGCLVAGFRKAHDPLTSEFRG
jgi:hypothetical protein